MNIMERKYEEGSEEEDACSIATMAAMDVITERCTDGAAEADKPEPDEGVYLRLHIRQELKAIYALALREEPSAKQRADNTRKQIDIGVEQGLISNEFGEKLKDAVHNALNKREYKWFSPIPKP